MWIGKRLPSLRTDKSLSVDTGYYKITPVSPSVDTGHNRMVRLRTPRSVSLFGLDNMPQSRGSQCDIGGRVAAFRVMFASSMLRHGLTLRGGAQPNEESHREKGAVCG
jgi:hypothetical protein